MLGSQAEVIAIQICKERILSKSDLCGVLQVAVESFPKDSHKEHYRV